MDNDPTSPPQSPPRRKRRKRQWPSLGAVGVAFVVYRLEDGGKARAQSGSQTGQNRNSRSHSAGSEEVPVATAKAVTGNVPVYLDGLGSVSPFYTVTVHTRVDGQLM